MFLTVYCFTAKFYWVSAAFICDFSQSMKRLKLIIRTLETYLIKFRCRLVSGFPWGNNETSVFAVESSSMWKETVLWPVLISVTSFPVLVFWGQRVSSNLQWSVWRRMYISIVSVSWTDMFRSLLVLFYFMEKLCVGTWKLYYGTNFRRYLKFSNIHEGIATLFAEFSVYSAQCEFSTQYESKLS